MKSFSLFGPFVVTVLVVQAACAGADNRYHATVAENVELPANEWVELGRDLELKTPGDNNEICLEPASPFVLRDDFSIAAPDGARIVPKVRLVSDRGEYALDKASLSADALWDIDPTCRQGID
jgi:hypothetical protein